jgi:hypothetical protein
MSYIAIRRCSSGAVIGSRVFTMRDEAEAEVKAWSEGAGPAAVAPATPAIRSMTRRNDSDGLARVLAELSKTYTEVMADLREPGHITPPELEYPHGVDICTNWVPRDVINAWELTPAEREDFDYLDWDRIEAGEDSAEFFRYRGDLYYLESEGTPAFAPGWHGYLSDSFFSGVIYRFPVDEYSPRTHDGDVNYDYERIIVGRYISIGDFINTGR